uniref:Uncharacterized protein n=1 Tax=Arundo donax TaxID=35708 RepID=A0A0A9GQ36_ARUDO
MDITNQSDFYITGAHFRMGVWNPWILQMQKMAKSMLPHTI